MKKFLGKRILTAVIAGCTAVSMIGCGNTNPKTEKNTQYQEVSEVQKIGVAMYSQSDEEQKMFKQYYEEYLKNAFEVKFFYSPEIRTLEDEKAFVDAAKKEGCEGIISFITNDLEAIVDYCGDDFYYTMGSATVSEEVFDSVADKKNFLGLIGPEIEDEKNAGAQMVSTLSGVQPTHKNYLILSGGTGLGNQMHEYRFEGMVATLKDMGFVFEKEQEALNALKETTLVAKSSDGGKVYVCPGYFMDEQNSGSVEKALEMDKIDVLASVCTINAVQEQIEEAETAQNADIQVGTVDCFSSANEEIINKEDIFGNPSLNFIAGKCAAMVAPSFVAMYNAVTGSPEVYREDGKAYWLHQGFWVATTPQGFEKALEKANNIYDNVYGTDEIMEVLSVYHQDITLQKFKTFVNSL